MTKAQQYIKQQLITTFNPTHIQVDDVSHQHIGHPGAKEGGHFILTIQAKQFTEKPLLACHRMIYDALGPLKQHGIHALTIRIQ